MSKSVPTNWNNLPKKIKRACVNLMDFKTRTLLRSTSHSDRDIVDSTGLYRFERVELCMKKNENTFAVRARRSHGYEINVEMLKQAPAPVEKKANSKSGKQAKAVGMRKKAKASKKTSSMAKQLVSLKERNPVQFDRVLQCLLQVLQRSSIETLFVGLDYELVEVDAMAIMNRLSEFTPINVRYFQIDADLSKAFPSCLLDICDEKTLEAVSLDGPMGVAGDAVVCKYFRKPQIINAKTVQLQCFNPHLSCLAHEFGLALNFLTYFWFNEPPPVGTRLLLGNSDPSIFQYFEFKYDEPMSEGPAINALYSITHEIRCPIDEEVEIFLYRKDGRICCDVISANVDLDDMVKNGRRVGDPFPHYGICEKHSALLRRMNAGF